VRNDTDHPGDTQPREAAVASNAPRPIENKPWIAHPAVKILLWSGALCFLLFTLVSVLIAVMALFAMGQSDDLLDATMRMDALQAAGVFGRGANAQMIASLRAVTGALKDNLLGFVGATIVLVVIALAAAHIVGDQRAQEKTAKLVQGVLMLAAATGLVA